MWNINVKQLPNESSETHDVRKLINKSKFSETNFFNQICLLPELLMSIAISIDRTQFS